MGEGWASVGVDCTGVSGEGGLGDAGRTIAAEVLAGERKLSFLGFGLSPRSSHSACREGQVCVRFQGENPSYSAALGRPPTVPAASNALARRGRAGRRSPALSEAIRDRSGGRDDQSITATRLGAFELRALAFFRGRT